jgi:c-di-GMP-binding flagellar brake protein YcgR
MAPLKENQKIKIIPEKISQISTGAIVSLETDYFVAKIDNPLFVKTGNSPEILITEEDYMLLFTSKVNKIENDSVYFDIPKKYCYIQKREYARTDVDLPVMINNCSTAKIVNIGGGGMQISTDTNYKLNSLINMEFNLSPKKKIKAEFKVLRVAEENNKFLLSGEFLELSNIDKTAIIQFCFKHQLELKYRK